MTEDATLSRLFVDLGPLIGEANIVEYAPEQTWVVELAADIQIVVEFNEGLDHLVVSAEVARVRVGQRAALFELLLKTNGLWRETGGIRFALAGDDGAVTQLLDIHAGGLEPHRLCAAILGFAERLIGWRAVVENWAVDTESVAPAASTVSGIIKA